MFVVQHRRLPGPLYQLSIHDHKPSADLFRERLVPEESLERRVNLSLLLKRTDRLFPNARETGAVRNSGEVMDEGGSGGGERHQPRDGGDVNG